jgi:hypothetical protein
VDNLAKLMDNYKAQMHYGGFYNMLVFMNANSFSAKP